MRPRSLAEIGHESAASLLALYAAGTLDPSDSRRLEAHLASCDECRADLALWLDVGLAVTEEATLLPRVSPRVLDGALARVREEQEPAVAGARLLATGQVRRRRPARLAVRYRVSRALWRMATLVRAQLLLLRQEVWLSSLLVMLLGYVVALVSGQGDRAASVIGALAPLVAAAGVALVYGPDVDPGLELALATPTSPRQVLLARLVVVFGYDLCLALAATVGLLPLVPVDLLGRDRASAG